MSCLDPKHDGWGNWPILEKKNNKIQKQEASKCQLQNIIASDVVAIIYAELIKLEKAI